MYWHMARSRKRAASSLFFVCSESSRSSKSRALLLRSRSRATKRKLESWAMRTIVYVNVLRFSKALPRPRATAALLMHRNLSKVSVSTLNGVLRQIVCIGIWHVKLGLASKVEIENGSNAKPYTVDVFQCVRSPSLFCWNGGMWYASPGAVIAMLQCDTLPKCLLPTRTGYRLWGFLPGRVQATRIMSQ